MPQGIILAAGMSSRANTNKLVLPIKGVPIVVALVKLFQQFCSETVVVTGHYRDEIEALVGHKTNVKMVHNPDYKRGMFTSVQKGVQHMKDDFFLMPGDYPLLKEATIKALLNGEGLIRVPVSHTKKGHPIFIQQPLIDPLLKEPLTSNLKRFRDRYEVNYIEVDDQGAVKDMDTMEDYHQLLELNKLWKGETIENS